MQELEAKYSQEDLQKYKGAATEQLSTGNSKWAVTQKLVEMGMEQNDAWQLVQSIAPDAAPAGQSVLKAGSTAAGVGVAAVVGAVIAAIIGGIVWGLIAKATGYEIGYLAVGMGFICGLAVVVFSGGRKGVPLQIVAIAASVLGILIGKYICFFYILKDVIAEKAGQDVAAHISLLSPKTIEIFISALPDMCGGKDGIFDLLWVGLAVYTAWKIPSAKEASEGETSA